MFKGIEIYKGRSFDEKIAVILTQVRGKIHYMVSRGEHLTVTLLCFRSLAGTIWDLGDMAKYIA